MAYLLRIIASIYAYREHGGQPFHFAYFSYDERGRVEAVIRSTENMSYAAVYYHYNSMGRITRVRASDALRTHTTWYSYDNNGRIDTVWSELGLGGTGITPNNPNFPTQGLGVKPATADITYIYGKRGTIDTAYYMAINAKVGYGFDMRGFLQSINAIQGTTTLFRQTLTRDASGLITRQEAEHRGFTNRVYNYYYDGVERLTNWSMNTPITTDYTYDVVGNRLSDNEGGVTSSYTYAGNKLMVMTTGSKKTTYDYDADGNMTRRASTSQSVSLSGTTYFRRMYERFEYSASGMVERYRKGDAFGEDTACMGDGSAYLSHDWRYRYSAMGGREQKREYENPDGESDGNHYQWQYNLLGAGEEQRVIWRGEQTTDPDTCGRTGRRVYLWASEYLVYGAMGAEMVSYPDTVNYGKKEVHFTDHLGSVRATWSELGERTATEYNPFGNVGWSLMGTKTRTFIGKESDAESNLGDFGARKYDARIGRFTSVDALWAIQPEHTPYHYSFNSPINYSDPSGLFPLTNERAVMSNAEMLLEEFNRRTGGAGSICGTLVTYHPAQILRDASPLLPEKSNKAYYTYTDFMGSRTSIGGSDNIGNTGSSTKPSEYSIAFNGPDKKASPAQSETIREIRVINSQLVQFNTYANGNRNVTVFSGYSDNIPEFTLMTEEDYFRSLPQADECKEAQTRQQVAQAHYDACDGLQIAGVAAVATPFAVAAVVEGATYVVSAVVTASTNPQVQEKVVQTVSTVGQGFKSFSAFKRAMGSAGTGQAWHHIVEQTPSNIAKFGNQAIHNTVNLMKLPHGAGTIHAKISGYYSSIQPFTGGQTVRQWLSTQSYQAQYDFGIQTLKNFGWTP